MNYEFINEVGIVGIVFASTIIAITLVGVGVGIFLIVNSFNEVRVREEIPPMNGIDTK